MEQDYKPNIYLFVYLISYFGYNLIHPLHWNIADIKWISFENYFDF